MNSNKNNQPSEPKSAKKSLLDELQSIKGLLEDNIGEKLDIEIPILDDVVHTSESDDDSKDYSDDTIDLESIFDDESKPLPTKAAESTNQEPGLTTDTTTADSTDKQDLSFDNLDFDIDMELDPQQLTDGDILNLDDVNQAIAIPSFKLDQAIEDNSLLISDDDKDDKHTDNYQEEQEEMFPGLKREPTSSSIQSSDSSNQFDMDLLIQEIVDEYIPSIEDTLRNRLSSLSEETIQQLAPKYLNKD